MKQGDVRNWLGLYFLLTTVALGGYILIFAHSPLLPMERSEGMATFQIVIPLFVGQLTAVFKAFMGGPLPNPGRQIDIPTWTVKAPPLLVIALFVCGVVAVCLSNLEGFPLEFGPTDFKTLVTFAVSVLNATTVFVVTKYFSVPQ
jgi:hypothetical protein